MEMEDMSTWRLGTKIVAIFDIIIFCIAIFVVALSIAFISASTLLIQKLILGQEREDNDEDGFDINGEFISRMQNKSADVTNMTLGVFEGDEIASNAITVLNTITWVIIVVFSICTLIQLWAAFQLLHSAEIATIRTNPVQSLRKATIWRNISIVFLILTILIGISTNLHHCFAVPVIIRLIFLFITMAFMRELREFIRYNENFTASFHTALPSAQQQLNNFNEDEKRTMERKAEDRNRESIYL